MSECVGIFQADIILRTAIMEGIRDLRKNPWLLDFAFASLKYDALTQKVYGQKEIQKAKDWFLKTEFPVAMRPILDEAKNPLISIQLLQSSESEMTLGDIHYEPQEDYDQDWPALTPQFTPVYDASTGICTVSLPVILTEGMLLIDSTGASHEILEVLGDGFRIAAGTVANFRNAVIKGTRPAYDLNLESVVYKEVYRIGVHTAGEQVTLTWLHSIVKFILLRYKETLLEARGLERTVFSSADFDRDQEIEEIAFARYITLTGYVREVWPKAVSQKLEFFNVQAEEL